MQGDYRRFSVRSGSARPYPAETHTPPPTQYPRGAHHNAGLTHQAYRLDEPVQPSPWAASASPPANHPSTGSTMGSPQYQRLGASPNSRSPGISASARRQDSASTASGRGRSASISAFADPYAMGGHSPIPQQPQPSFLRPAQSHYEASPPPGRPPYQPIQPQPLTARGSAYNGYPSQSQEQSSEARNAHLLNQPSWLRQGQSNFGPTPSTSSPQPLRPNSQRQPLLQQNHHGHQRPVTTDQFRAGLRVIEYDSRDDRTPVRTYTCGELLGKGAFAKVFEMIEDATGISYAVKVVEKRGLTDESKKNKLLTEIRLHKRLKHKNVLNFVRYFQDEHFHYLVLERCLRYSLMEFNKDGYKFSVPEAQFILLQLIDAVSYLHSQNVIHRDLKLGNVLIDPFLNAKVGDFGLATELTYSGQRKWTRCGTPNYIAPEVLNDEGYGFACDIWSLGVLLYTLLVGIPPFETNNLQATYQRIRQGHYVYPSSAANIPQVARSLIASMLQVQPDRRPQLVDIRLDPFFRGAPRIAPASLTRGLPADDVNLVREAASRPPMTTPLDGFSPVHDFPGCETPTESLPTPTFDAALQHGVGSMTNVRELTGGHVFPSASHPNTAILAAQGGHGQQARGPQYEAIASRSNSPLFDALPEPVTLGRNVMHPIHSAATGGAATGAAGQEPDGNKPSLNVRQTKEGIPAPKPLLGTPRPSSQPQQNDVVADGTGYSAMQRAQQLSVRQPNLPSSLNQKDLRKPRNGLEGKPCYPLFVTRVLDYTRKYGVGCELSDGSISATYNDRTKLLWKLSNNTVAYYCRLPRPPSLEGDTCTSPSELHDILHDAFMVTEDGELRPGDPQSPQERQTRKKMTLAKYFKTCIDGSLLKERTAIVNLFPPANRDPTANDRDRIGSGNRMSNQAAASGNYIKSVTTVVMKDFASIEEWQRSFWCSTTISPNGDPSDLQAAQPTSAHASDAIASMGTFNFLVFRFSDQSAQICFEPAFFASDGSLRPEGIRYLCSCEETSATNSTTQTTSRSSATTSVGSSSATPSTASGQTSSTISTSSASVESFDALDDLRHSLGSRHMGLSLILSGESVRTETELFPTTPFRPLDGDRGAWIALSASAPVTRCGEGHPAYATPGPSSSAVHPAQFVQYPLSELWSDRRNPHGHLLPRSIGHRQANESASFLRTLWVVANGVLAACNGVGQSSPSAGSSPPL